MGGGYGNPSRPVTAIGVWTKVCNHSPRTKNRRGHYRLEVASSTPGLRENCASWEGQPAQQTTIVPTDCRKKKRYPPVSLWPLIIRIVAAEIDGREARALSKKSLPRRAGKKPAAGPDDALGAVLKIAELLNSDKAIKARLAELKKATKDARAEIVASGRECVAVDKAKADAQAEYHKHQEQMAGELKQHRGVGGWTAELDSVKKQAADLKAKAEADAAAAAKIRADLQRRLKLITEAA